MRLFINKMKETIAQNTIRYNNPQKLENRDQQMYQAISTRLTQP